MTVLNVEPFNKKEFVEELKASLPNYKVKLGFGITTVRTSNFTVTGNVQINMYPKKGKIKIQTRYDSVILWLIFITFLGIYVYLKKKKQIALEQEVVEKIKTILKEREVSM